jgi:MFS family permease
MSTAGFVGAVISFFIGGRLIDFIANRSTSRKGGIAEPEYRLPAMIFPAIIGPMGVLTYGMIIADKKNFWGAIVGFAMLGFALTAASNVVVTYAVDAYRPVSFPFHTSKTPPPPNTQRAVLIWYVLDFRRNSSYCLCGQKCHGLPSITVHSGLDCS